MTEASGKGSVRVRLGPSPTGPLHFGTARTAFFNWVFAHQHDGVFILRIEDTDKERSEKRYEDELIEGLQWLGIDWDEGPGHKGKYGPYRQSERTEIYKRYLEQLLKEEKAYYCYCSKEDLEAERQSFITQGLPPKYSGHCRNTRAAAGKSPTSIRFKTPESQVTFNDLVRGTVTFDAGLFGDMVIAKNLETPLYNFAVVVDDEEMRISHVIRGEDHLSNTPKQILFQKALGFKTPEYGHLPLILAKDRSKLSKRFAETSLLSYREAGYLPEAMMNFMALLGWHPQGDEEVLTPDEIIKKFNIKKVQKGGAVFNQEKLDWLNSQHLKKLSLDDLAKRIDEFFVHKEGSEALLKDKRFLKNVVEIERERLTTIGEFQEIAGFFFILPEYDPSLLIWDNETKERTLKTLEDVRELMKNAKEPLKRQNLEEILDPMIQTEGKGKVLWPLRVAVSGRTASPDPLDIMMVLGKEESVKRLSIAIQKISEHA